MKNKAASKENISINHTFYPRVVNHSNINFTRDELDILNKGLKHNFPPSSWKSNLINEVLNAETAVNVVKDDQVKTVIRHVIDRKVDNVSKLNANKKFRRIVPNEKTVIESIKDKLIENKCLITKADKGQSLVVMNTADYIDKVNSFIANNDITQLNDDPTAKFHQSIKAILNRTNCLLTKSEIRQLKMMNPRVPFLRGLPKLHKTDIPVRPLVNFTTAPSYKLAKKLDRILRNNIKLHNSYSIKNSFEVAQLLSEFKIANHHTMASFDITNLYTNVPVDETISLVKNNLENYSDLTKGAIEELVMLLRTVLQQNYFQFNNSYYIQNEGLAMGSPLSSILAEIYLNNIEINHIFSPTSNVANNILFYRRYVDDTLVIYKGNVRQLEILNNKLNAIAPKLKFTLETEVDNKLNFLDLTLHKVDNKIEFSIYRKPTATDHTIDNSSYHPITHKMAAYNSLVHRLLTIPLSPENYRNEVQLIKHIAVANGYNSSIVDRIILKQRSKRKNNSCPLNTSVTKAKPQFVSVEYGGLLHNKLKNELRKHNVVLASKTSNKLENKLNVNKPAATLNNGTDGTGVYRLTCNDCPMMYIGQTGRSFKKRFSEHLPKPSLQTQKSRFAEHLVVNNHNVSDISTNLDILHKCKKSQLMNTLEEMEIYRSFKLNPDIVINEKLKYNNNILYNRVELLKTVNHDNNRTADSQGQVGVG